jgi:hypothetical protein
MSMKVGARVPARVVVEKRASGSRLRLDAT